MYFINKWFYALLDFLILIISFVFRLFKSIKKALITKEMCILDHLLTFTSFVKILYSTFFYFFIFVKYKIMFLIGTWTLLITGNDIDSSFLKCSSWNRTKDLCKERSTQTGLAASDSNFLYTHTYKNILELHNLT